MIDEENQQNNSSHQTEYNVELKYDIWMGKSDPVMGDLPLDMDLNLEFDSENNTSSLGTVADAASGENWSSGAAEEASLESEARDRELEALRLEMESLKAQLEATSNQCESYKTQSMRMAADFDNFRKRTAKEKEDLEIQVKAATLSKLLPVVDDFERARSHIKPQTEGEMNIHKSYQSVYKQLVDCLKRLGVSPMRPEGKEFDPNLHEAVMREPTNEHPEGTVMEELVRGYFLGERILRHAMVKVAAATDSVIPSEEGHSDTAEN
ncbi:MAG: nucleotide exchange factor GrpE [Microcoleus sp. T3-bin5]|nr:nucleotide exchange factor GrpE [Microcoleus sp. T3-bin5]